MPSKPRSSSEVNGLTLVSHLVDVNYLTGDVFSTGNKIVFVERVDIIRSIGQPEKYRGRPSLLVTGAEANTYIDVV